MTKSLLELSADRSTRKIFQRTSFPKRWPPRLSEGEECRTTFLQMAIGREIRSIRTRHGMTALELATSAGISAGMLSKVENGSISPSLDTLQALSSALGVSVSALFRRFGGKSRAVLVKAGKGMDVERRGTRAGHHYNLLGYIGSSTDNTLVEPYLITLSQPSDEFPIFHHDGTEFLYLLEGEFVYRHGDNLYRMSPGDSLFFDADTPHGPNELMRFPIRFLSVISYRVGQSVD